MHNTTTREYRRPPSALAYMLRGALPSRRRSDLTAASSARWLDHRVEPRQLSRFLALTGQRDTADPHILPILYPHTVGFRLAMSVLTDPTFPVPIWSVLQIRNHLLQRQPIDVGASLDFELEVVAGRVTEKGAEIDLHTTVYVDGADVWESLVTFYTRGDFGEPQAASPLARGPSSFGGLTASWTMPDDGHRQFGALTGDYNGIHLWSWYARRFGFDKALYHPPRVLGHCVARLPGLDPRAPQRLDVWLKGSVPHGAAVRLHADAAAATGVFALFVEPTRPAIVGRYKEESVGARLFGAASDDATASQTSGSASV